MTNIILSRFVRDYHLTKGVSGKGNGVEYVLLGTGHYVVPEHLIDSHLRTIAKSVFFEDPLYLTELRGDLFHFYADFHFTTKDQPQEADRNHLLQAVLLYMHVLKSYFPNIDPSTCRVILCNTTRQIVHDDQRVWKSAMRLVCPELLVNLDQALDIRATALQEVVRGLGASTNSLEETWNLVLDESTYFSPGVRVLGTRKMEFCPRKCKRQRNGKRIQKQTGFGNQEGEGAEDRSGCEYCHRHGKLDVGAVYKVASVLNLGGEILDQEKIPLIEDLYKGIRSTRIAALPHESITEGFVRPTWAAPLVTYKDRMSESFRNKTKQHTLNKNVDDLTNRDDPDTWLKFLLPVPVVANTPDETGVIRVRENEDGIKRLERYMRKIPETAPVFQECCRLLGVVYNRRYAECTVRAVYCESRKNRVVRYAIVLDGSDAASRFCHNVIDQTQQDAPGGVHASNAVYFDVRFEGIMQQCFCTNDTTVDRRYGPCKSMRLPAMERIPEASKTLLFVGDTSKSFEHFTCTHAMVEGSNYCLQATQIASMLHSDPSLFRHMGKEDRERVLGQFTTIQTVAARLEQKIFFKPPTVDQDGNLQDDSFFGRIFGGRRRDGQEQQARQPGGNSVQHGPVLYGAMPYEMAAMSEIMFARENQRIEEVHRCEDESNHSNDEDERRLPSTTPGAKFSKAVGELVGRAGQRWKKYSKRDHELATRMTEDPFSTECTRRAQSKIARKALEEDGGAADLVFDNVTEIVERVPFLVANNLEDD